MTEAFDWDSIDEDPKKGFTVPPGGGKPVRTKTLVGKAIRCPACSTSGQQVAASAEGEAWSCHCGAGGELKHLIGNADAILRNGKGQPWIIQPDGSVVAYSRASSIGKLLEYAGPLSDWKLREAARGLQMQAELLLEVEATQYLTDERERKSALADIIDRAHEASGATARRELGTLLHTVTEALDKNYAPPEYPAANSADVEAYLQRTQGWLYAGLELFVVNDAHRSAGSFDRLRVLTQDDGSVVLRIGDLKTCDDFEWSSLCYSAQQAVYVGGVLYHPLTGERWPLETLAVREPMVPLDKVRIDTEIAELIHLPAGAGHCAVIPVPLAQAREALETAVKVRTLRNQSKSWLGQDADAVTLGRPGEDYQVDTPTPAPVDPLADAIAAATGYDQLTALYLAHAADRGGDGAWTAEHTALAKARRALIDGGLAA